MTETTREIDAINVNERVVIDSCGGFGDIRTFLDIAGEETDDSAHAIVAIVEWRADGLWSPVVIADFSGKRN